MNAMDRELASILRESARGTLEEVSGFPVLEKGFSSDPPGSGGRFKACVASGKSKALCAYIGRRKYGKAGMARLAAKGRKG